MINLIRFFGWFGIALNAIAIVSQNLYLFLLGQLVASVSGFLWQIYLQKGQSVDIYLSLVLTIASVLFKNQWLVYAAMLSRSVSYQFVFERVVKQNK